MISRALPLIAIALVFFRGLIADLDDPILSSIWASGASLCAGLGLVWARSARRTPTVYLTWLWATLALISAGWSVDIGATLHGGTQLAAASLLGLYLGHVATRHSRALTWSLVLSASVAGTYALRQVFISFPALEQSIAEGTIEVETATRFTVSHGRAFGTYLAPDLLAAALGSALLLTLGLLIRERGRMRIYAACCGLLQLSGLIATRSVGAGVVLATATLIFAAASRLQRPAGLSRNLRGLAVVALMLAAVAIAGPRIPGAMNRASERLTNQRTAFRGLAENPLLGTGYNTFGAAAPARKAEHEKLTRYAHGWLGQAASDLGAVGLCLTLTLLFLWSRITWRALRHDDIQTRLSATATLVALGHGLLDYDLMMAENWLLLLALVALSSHHEAAHAAGGQRHLSLRAPLFILATAVLALSVWRATLSIAVAGARSQESCESRAPAMASAARLSWRDADLYRQVAWEWLSCRPLGPNRVLTALDWLDRARAASPSQAVLRAEQALVLSHTSDHPRALHEIDQAVASWPTVGRVHALRALTMRTLGRAAEARTSLQRAIALDPTDPMVRDATGQMLGIAPRRRDP